MPFKKGDPKPPGSGRRKGQVCRRGIGPSDAAISSMTRTQLEILMDRLQATLKAKDDAEKAVLDARRRRILEAAYARFGENAWLRTELDQEAGAYKLFVRKTVVAQPSNNPTTVCLEDIRQDISNANVGDVVWWTISEAAFMAPQTEERLCPPNEAPTPGAVEAPVLTAGTTDTPQPTTPLDVIVEITDASPAPAVIQAGGSVTWTNRTPHPVTLTSDGGLWDAATITPGDSYGLAFTPPGSYPYSLTSSEGTALLGKVEVVAANSEIEIGEAHSAPA